MRIKKNKNSELTNFNDLHSRYKSTIVKRKQLKINIKNFKNLNV